MKNVYMIENYVRFNDEWEEIFTLDCHYKYLTPEEAKTFEETFCATCRTFEELREQVGRFPGIVEKNTPIRNLFPNIKEKSIFFANRSYILVRGSDWASDGKYYDEKHFKKPVSFKKVCAVANNLSLNDLMKVLTAKDFADWWKDHTGETQCPFKKNS